MAMRVNGICYTNVYGKGYTIVINSHQKCYNTDYSCLKLKRWICDYEDLPIGIPPRNIDDDNLSTGSSPKVFFYLSQTPTTSAPASDSHLCVLVNISSGL